MSPQPIRERNFKARVNTMSPVTEKWFHADIEPFFSKSGFFIVMMDGVFDVEFKWDALFIEIGREDVLVDAIERWTGMLDAATPSTMETVMEEIRAQKAADRIKAVQWKIRTNGRKEIEICVFQPFDLIHSDDTDTWKVASAEDGRDYKFFIHGGDLYITGIASGPNLPPYHTTIVRGSELLTIVEEMKIEHNQKYTWTKQFSKTGKWTERCYWYSTKFKGCQFWYMEDGGRVGQRVWKQLAYISEKNVPNLVII
jgi:hypothetical protein